MASHYWWQSGVIYEVLVSSFQDSNDDGWGDLNGLTQRLDYFVKLGVDVLWLTPINRSPMYDAGYDVTSFTEIDPIFGTLEDFVAFLSAAHERSLKVVLDFVPNHTSNEHKWFQESQSSRDNAYADWYLWSNPKFDGRPPNNWVNRFGTSGWTWNPAREQYYFGSFSSNQPDLNWRNQQVRRAIYDAMRYWLKLGVDGLRVDALSHFIKDADLRDNPPNLAFDDSQEPSNKLALIYHQNQPELLDVISEMRAVFDEFEDRVFIGEVYQTPEQITAYQNAGAQLLLSTSILQTQFDAVHLRNIIDLVEGRTAVGAWPARCSGNHDIGRVCDRVPSSHLRLAALLHFTLRGTPTMYYGEELGLCHVHVPEELSRDPSGKLDSRYGRDKYRAPMPWNSEVHGGFGNADPYLPTDSQTLAKNVEAQSRDNDSLLNFYCNLLAFRKQNLALQIGRYRPIDTSSAFVAYTRQHDDQHLLMVFNFSDTVQVFDLHEHFNTNYCAKILFSTIFRPATPCSNRIELAPNEGVITKLKETAS